ncbi:dihydroneopterin aldolase [Alicyclobacillus cellulosilyticus]|uniref:7,8-dihydroneopterin aldolase n=1 Tax=Alicyclobacillus cellulosilyticus TaxID=1003997 RepID=A0A917KG44_9BACL|nr:dihydroneopterin aldolase [Alicyclobacillus cellulosilyticus]GGJ12372.1 dihydroneopterin aldolase [Alicyclobacillus cellulosilyticus]
MDEIFIRGLVCYGYHGVFPEERRLGQRFIVHLRLGLNLASAAAADNLEQSVDYGAVCQTVQRVVEGEPQQLIERVAERVCETLFTQFPKLEQIEVEVVKPGAPIPVPFAEVGVRLVRQRTAR